MNSRWIERLGMAAIAFVLALAAGRLWPSGPTPAAADTTAPTVTTGLVPRFIDFDIGAATVRAGADHQDFLSDSPPYVELPNTGYPLTLLNFTAPPDYADDSDFVVRVLFSTAPDPCSFVLNANLVGYGPGHSAALFDAYWPGDVSPTPDGIVTAPSAYNTHEVIITFDAHESFPTYPGDALTLNLARDTAATADTCPGNVLLRSVSVTYDGWTSYIPLTVK